eukprot:4163584-Pyramimonas_sp.AAC.1
MRHILCPLYGLHNLIRSLQSVPRPPIRHLHSTKPSPQAKKRVAYPRGIPPPRGFTPSYPSSRSLSLDVLG